MKTRLLLTFLVTLCAVGMQAQGPNNSGTYYRNANGKSGEALKTALYGIISKKTHSPSYDELITLYEITDTRADGCVRDWYSNITHFTHGKDKAGSYKKEGDVYNREHSVPQSWGAPKADIVHVVPTDGYVNNRRGNYPFGEVGNITYQSANGYSKLGSCKTAGYSGTVFEPNDEVKGDIARIYFYMATCYEGSCQNWGNDVFTGTKYQPMAQWAFDMMVRWSKLDPVDEVEIARNNAVARTDVQGNRNPFVDYPGLEDYVWGDKKSEAFSYDNYQGGGGGTVVTDRVEQPVFSPDGGTFTDRVEVTITTATEGATIYYTTNGAEASVNSKVYEDPITLTSNTTLKAIAVKEGMSTSYQTTANFVITSSGGTSEPTDVVDIALNNSLFGTACVGSLSGGDLKAYTGTKNGITVTYDKGTGSNMYLNDAQLRVYPGNTLTISTANGTLSEVEFTIVLNKNGKTIEATTGTVADGIWTGNAQSVTFGVNSGSGHIQLSQAKVKCTSSSGVSALLMNNEERIVNIYDLQGRRISSAEANFSLFTLHSSLIKRGLYIVNGKKVIK